MSDSPYQSPLEPSKTYADQGLVSGGVVQPLYEKRLWLKMLGVAFVIGGVLYCITIIGAIFGVPILIIGINLYQAAEHFEMAARGETGRNRAGCEKLALSIQIGGILMLIGLIFMALYILFIIGMIFFGVLGGALQ